MKTIKERVADGAMWLDQNYPQWFNKIDLGILDLGSCTQCVLGQVYTGVIPEQEKGQVLAQVLANITEMYDDLDVGDVDTWRKDYQVNLADGVFGGYNVISDFHKLDNGGEDYGFVCSTYDNFDHADQVRMEGAEYAALLEEWTRVIVSRRLEFHRSELVAA